jgi:hypothetical protein
VRKYCCADEYKTFSSPGGEFQIVVFKIHIFPMMMPGSSGDAPGFVRLFGKTEKYLKRKIYTWFNSLKMLSGVMTKST